MDELAITNDLKIREANADKQTKNNHALVQYDLIKAHLHTRHDPVT